MSVSGLTHQPMCWPPCYLPLQRCLVPPDLAHLQFLPIAHLSLRLVLALKIHLLVPVPGWLYQWWFRPLPPAHRAVPQSWHRQHLPHRYRWPPRPGSSGYQPLSGPMPEPQHRFQLTHSQHPPARIRRRDSDLQSGLFRKAWHHP